MEFQFESETEIETQSLYDAIEVAYPNSVSQITVTDQNTYIVQAKDMSEEQLQFVEISVGEALGEFEMLRFTTIGPKIGSTLKNKAIIALSVALIAIVLYIAYAFRKVPKRVSPWKFGFCAIVALAHDIVITLGVFALLGFEVNAFFITALLTIMGFSVHDTIVVFDRIRENLIKHPYAISPKVDGTRYFLLVTEGTLFFINRACDVWAGPKNQALAHFNGSLLDCEITTEPDHENPDENDDT